MSPKRLSRITCDDIAKEHQQSNRNNTHSFRHESVEYVRFRRRNQTLAAMLKSR